ncbi:MAG TPA: Dna2/Cas4 domain-containing protein, partial [Phycisphaerae bacterium]|nr:Dna2/Cas4 domain-containing protein [Phycisphaerae bacterium]
MPSTLAQLTDDGDLTIDMLSQYAYCPRRFHLMYVQGRWADNAFTVEGRNVHRRVDQLDHVLPDAESSSAVAPAGGVAP